MFYAAIQWRQGNAYSRKPKGDRTANLKQAIACYEEALRYWTPETAPIDYAEVQVSLGNAYSSLPTGDHTANLKQAIACYEEALRYQTRKDFPLDYAWLQLHLGDVYRHLPTGNRAANLKQAITFYEEAQSILGPKTAPHAYAALQHNLGLAYSSLPTGDHTANLKQAIACYEEALHYWTPKTAPRGYAGVQNSLGIAYSSLQDSDRTANIARAITCYQEALRFFTSQAAPFDYRRINRNLANLYFADRKWSDALDTYRATMDVGIELYRRGVSLESRAREMFENTTLYSNAAFAAFQCKETAEALRILERGKTRLLTEALQLRIPRPANIPDEVWRTFEHAVAAVRALQTKEETTFFAEERVEAPTYDAYERVLQSGDVAWRRALELESAIEAVSRLAPDFLLSPDLSITQTLLPDERTALIAFCVTDHGSIAFVVGHSQEVEVIEIPSFTKAQLHGLLMDEGIGERPIGWISAYLRYLNEHTTAAFDVWQKALTDILIGLSQCLLVPVLSALPASIERIIFLPCGELFVLPLHAAPLPVDGDSDRVCDRYQISYTPSIDVLSNIQARAVQVAIPELYAVVNPEADPRLIFTPFEGKNIAELFARYNIVEGRAGIKQRVAAEMSGRTYVHFSCHGSYNWADPRQSGLILADSRLTLDDLQNGTIDMSTTRLVTLSACETGITDVLRSSAEEYVSIPAGFLIAGVPCIISSLWAVPELSTALLMERFYRNHLTSGMSFAAALREAQLWVRELKAGEVADYAKQCYQRSNQRDVEKRELLKHMLRYHYLAEQNPTLRPFTHPYYWAAFTVTGM